MTTTEEPRQPVWLTIDCPPTLLDLGLPSVILAATYGVAPLLVPLHSEDIGWAYFKAQPTDKQLLEILGDLDLSPNEYGLKTADPNWVLDNLAQQIFEAAQRRNNFVHSDWPKDVRVIVAQSNMMLNGPASLLPRLAASKTSNPFPNATYFVASAHGSGLTESLSTMPWCHRCLMSMKRAGSAYVCESCGSVFEQK